MLARIVDESLVSEAHYLEKKISGEIDSFSEGILESKNIDIQIGGMTFRGDDLRRKIQERPIVGISTMDAEDSMIEFSPVGIGNPLSIELRYVNTGQHPKEGWFKSGKRLLITSAVKDPVMFEAAPRAINLLTKESVEAHSIVNPLSAVDQGTPLIYYSPALMSDRLGLTLEFGFDEFPDDFLKIVQKGLSGAAGLPIFAAHSMYLISAGTVIGLVGKVASLVFDRRPAFRSDEQLNFWVAGTKPVAADFRVIVDDKAGDEFLANHKFKDGELRDLDGEPYRGEYPVAVIALDGRKQTNYDGFKPTAAAAAILDRYYRISEGQEESLEVLQEALGLYNDLTYFKQAQRYVKELDSIKGDTEDDKKRKKELNDLIKAAKNNFTSDTFKNLAIQES